MATWELGSVDNSPIGQATPAAGAFTVLKASTDPVDAHGVGDRGYNDVRYAGLGGHAATHTDGTDDIQNATAAQKGVATAAQITKLDGIETGATKYPDTGEQAFLDADHTKLDGIETAATKYPDTGEQAFLDADHTKLNGIETAADVTDATNVAAAGGLINSNNLSDVGTAATAFSNIKQAATETATGVIEKATTVECVTGTDTARAVTPAGLTSRMAAPGAIGGTTPAVGTFTELTATTKPLSAPFWMSKGIFLDENTANVANKPSLITRGVFGGYSLPEYASGEELLFRARVPHRWDGTTKPFFVAITSISAAEDIGDKYKFQLEWQSEDILHVIPATIQETLTCEVTVADGTAFYAELISFELTATTLVAGQNIQARLRRIAASSSSVSNEIIVWHWDMRWKMSQIGTESSSGY